MSSRKMVATFAVAMMLLVGAASAVAGSTNLTDNSGLIDQMTNFAEQARAAGGHVTPQKASKAAALEKFSAAGSVNETIDAGGCSGNPLTPMLCATTADCAAITMQGTVNATSISKNATLDACLTLIQASSLGECESGLGTGTLSANGNSVNISFGGDFCLSDEIISTVTVYAVLNLGYVVEGGTGSLATATGNGNLATSLLIVNPMGPPESAAGDLTMTGTLSK